MAGTPIHHAHVDIGTRSAGKALEEIGDQFRLQVADAGCANLRLHDGDSAAAEIYRCQAQGFVHGHKKVARPQNAAPIAESAVEYLAKRDADILHRVVLIDIEVTMCRKLQIESAMAREEFQHVVEKANAG